MEIFRLRSRNKSKYANAEYANAATKVSETVQGKRISKSLNSK